MKDKRLSIILAAFTMATMMFATVYSERAHAEDWGMLPSGETLYDKDSAFLDNTTGYVVVTEGGLWGDSGIAIDCTDWLMYFGVLSGLSEYNAGWRSEPVSIVNENHTFLANQYCPIRGSLPVGNIQ